jgi:hypothetical protein
LHHSQRFLIAGDTHLFRFLTVHQHNLKSAKTVYCCLQTKVTKNILEKQVLF